MMGAVKLNLSTTMDGPSGAGKTEMCKDLSKAVGKKCVVFNCSNGKQYGSYLCGAKALSLPNKKKKLFHLFRLGLQNSWEIF